MSRNLLLFVFFPRKRSAGSQSRVPRGITIPRGAKISRERSEKEWLVEHNISNRECAVNAVLSSVS
jgi:hypothetical protein